jgi:hypothetical protein
VERDDAQALVCPRELVARPERLGVEDSGVDEHDVKREAGLFGEAAHQGAGALHAGEDRSAVAERGVREAEELDRGRALEAAVQDLEVLLGDAHRLTCSRAGQPWNLRSRDRGCLRRIGRLRTPRRRL